MKNTISTFLIILSLSQAIFAQDTKLIQDKKAIKSMCGCFEVGFNFAETFSYSDDSTYIPSKTKHETALEWAELVEDTDKKIVIQHLLIVGDSAHPMIIKHWRQDWEFENNSFFMFNADNRWSYLQLPQSSVKGQWTQKVYQVDDSPRYEGTATWVHVDGKSFWENTTNAPLPRREYTQRSDYNLTIRRNRHEITPTGWVHDQDNDKVIHEDGKEAILLAQEKGYNTYVRVDDARCSAAKKWWTDNQAFWADVRLAWTEVYGKGKNLELAEKVDGKHLYEFLFEMDPSSDGKKVKKVIKSFVQ